LIRFIKATLAEQRAPWTGVRALAKADDTWNEVWWRIVSTLYSLSHTHTHTHTHISLSLSLSLSLARSYPLSPPRHTSSRVDTTRRCRSTKQRSSSCAPTPSRRRPTRSCIVRRASSCCAIGRRVAVVSSGRYRSATPRAPCTSIRRRRRRSGRASSIRRPRSRRRPFTRWKISICKVVSLKGMRFTILIVRCC
jgi:hypothetical protein